jgi:hypothetical protein
MSGAAARPRASTPDPACGEARGRRRIGSERGRGAAGIHPVTQTRFKRTERTKRLERSDSSRGRMDDGKGRKAPRDSRGPARPFSPDHRAMRGFRALRRMQSAGQTIPTANTPSLSRFYYRCYEFSEGIVCAYLRITLNRTKVRVLTDCLVCWHVVPRPRTFGEGR